MDIKNPRTWGEGGEGGKRRNTSGLIIRVKIGGILRTISILPVFAQHKLYVNSSLSLIYLPHLPLLFSSNIIFASTHWLMFY